MTEMTAELPVQSETALTQQDLKGHASSLRGVKGLWFLLRSRWVLVSAAAMSSAVAVALGLVHFFCVAKMATAIFRSPAQLEDVRYWAVVAVVATAVRFAFASLAHALAHVAAFRLLHDVRLRIARKLGTVPLSFFSSRTSGQLKRLMMDDVNQIEAFVAHHFPDGVAAFTVPLFTAGALLVVDWRMALASIAVAPLAFAAMAVAMRDVSEAHRRWYALQDRTNNSLLEYFRGIHVIKTFGLTAKSFGDLSRSIEEGLTWMVDFMRKNGRGYGAFGALIGSSLLALMPVGGWLFLEGSLSLESLVLFLILGPQLLTSMLRLMFAWGNIQRIEEGNARITDVLTAPELSTGTSRSELGELNIEFRGVSFHYREDKETLSNVGFLARAGQVTALVGPSGAGKTTLARLVPRLWDTTKGAVLVGGHDVKELPLDTLLSCISVVFQDVFLFHGTVRENLSLAKPNATGDELVRVCKAARAHDFISSLPQGYDTLLGERGTRLSGGEKQRLSIARALLKDAPILVLDEATAFADAESEALIQEALNELCVGRTILVVAHRLSTIAEADHIVVLNQGEVADQGTHEQLLQRCKLYITLWRHHTEALGWSLQPETLPKANEVTR